jgi:transcription termination/antitermination protein NusG
MPNPICVLPNPWFALWTRSRHEKVVLERLLQKGFEAFLPTFVRWRRERGHLQKANMPLFPGYCFARFETTRRLAVLECIGVVGIVSVQGRPAPIPDQELVQLQQVIETKLAFDPCPYIREGMLVEVVSGPMRGIEGRLLRKDGKKATVVLGVELINRALKIEVEAADIEVRSEHPFPITGLNRVMVNGQ